MYDDKIRNASVRYGRNAANNFIGYINSYRYNPVKLPDMKQLKSLSEDKFEAKIKQLDDAIEQIGQQEMPPLNFEYTYSEVNDGLIDTMSLMGASYEELGGASIKTSELSKKLKETFTPSIFKQLLSNLKAKLKGRPTDKIVHHKTKLTAKGIDLNNDGKINVAEYATNILASDIYSNGKVEGVINNQGQNRLLGDAKKENIAQTREMYSALYQQYNLKEAQEKFLSDLNNLS